MPLDEQAAERVALARRMGRAPVRWIATEAVAREMGLNGQLHGVAVERGETRWGLELVCARSE